MSVCVHEPTRSDRSLAFAFFCMRVTFWKMSAENQPFVMSHRAVKALCDQWQRSQPGEGATYEKSGPLMKRTKKKSVPSVETCIHLCHSVLRCCFLFFCFLSPRSGNTRRRPLLEASQKPLNLIGVSGTATHKQFKTCFSVVTVTAATNDTMSRV